MFYSCFFSFSSQKRTETASFYNVSRETLFSPLFTALKTKKAYAYETKHRSRFMYFLLQTYLFYLFHVKQIVVRCRSLSQMHSSNVIWEQNEHSNTFWPLFVSFGFLRLFFVYSSPLLYAVSVIWQCFT